jgi:hypothetical protein
MQAKERPTLAIPPNSNLNTNPNPTANQLARARANEARDRRYYNAPNNVFLPMPRGPHIRPTSPGFANAKKISMRERGWQEFFPFEIELGHRGIDTLVMSQPVLLAESDGPEREAMLLIIQKDTSSENSKRNNMKDIFAFQSLDGTSTWDKTRGELYDESIKIYKKVRAVPFRQGGGFYPSVYSGISGASMLAPLIARQTLRMYNSSTKKRTKSKKQKKTLRKKNLRKKTRAFA